MEDLFEGIPSTTVPAVRPEPLPIQDMLPRGFNLPLLLTFVPDVKLKIKVEQAAKRALAIDISAPGGLEQVDAELSNLKTALQEVETCFDEPTSLANQLHKRMTGLRGDFCKAGAEAVITLAKRIIEEKRRQDVEAERKREADQRAADEALRKQLAEEAKQAKAAGASKTEIADLKQQAKTATAPPVAAQKPTLAKSNVTANWKCQPVGTRNGDEPNPEMKELTKEQQLSVRALMLACAQGQQPMTCFEINWSVLNTRAKADEKTLAIPGMEAIDVGSVRKK